MYYCGIDLLKIISMFAIIILHLLAHGGILHVAQGTHYAINWLLEILCFGAVNVYALISGFLGFGKKHRFSRYLVTWLQVVFYGLGLSMIALCLNSAGWKDVLNAIFPVASFQYWYFTAYTGTFLLMPALDRLIEGTKREWVPQIIIGLFLFSCYVAMATEFDPFVLRAGYSFVWLSILYYIGGMIQKFELHTKVRPRTAAMIFVCLSAVTYLWKMATGFSYPFVAYTSPTVLAGAVCLLLAFANQKSEQNRYASLAAATFGVYLLHESPIVRTFLIHQRFSFVTNLHPLLILPIVLCTAAAIFCTCLIIDKLRMCLFKALRINALAEKAEALLGGLIQRLASFIRI